MEKRKLVKLFGVLGGLDCHDEFEMSYDCSLEKMQELRKVLDALEIEYKYVKNEYSSSSQYVLRISCNDELGSTMVFSYERKMQGF